MLRYLKGVIVDQDFGVSLKMQKDRPVLDIITEKFPSPQRSASSLWYGPWRWSIPLGCLAAYNRGKWVDSVLRVVCTLGVSMPGFVVATFLLMLFCNDGPFKFTGHQRYFGRSRGQGLPDALSGPGPLPHVLYCPPDPLLHAGRPGPGLYQDRAGQGSADSPGSSSSTPCAMVSSPSSPTWAP